MVETNLRGIIKLQPMDFYVFMTQFTYAEAFILSALQGFFDFEDNLQYIFDGRATEIDVFLG